MARVRKSKPVALASVPAGEQSAGLVRVGPAGWSYADWAGILWQYPPNNWGDLDGGIDLTGATKLTFWARGECGGEIINAFKCGGMLGAYPDTGSAHITRIELGREWARYEINLTDIDISYISSFFTVVMNKISNPDGCTIYLDDIRLE